jgi:hypothetical protein
MIMGEWIDATRRSPDDSKEDVLVLYWEDATDSGVSRYPGAARSGPAQEGGSP